ncbi:LytR/AlgR family response regulator transcription factor [Fulvivirga lutea]|uniref:Response regulator n=1 Tax=Fulvivirga lutea TaxID=2810512 RepID=A0A974WJ20_9BACT|nr:response regulator [Fulvivirga lutea]QSE97055.1 response regulator [Fulvivirga lutea]
MNKIRVLIVEDEFIIAEDLRDILEEQGHEVVGLAGNFNNGIQLIEAELPDIVLLDIRIKGEKDGIDLAKEIRLKYKVPFIFISSYSDSVTVKRASEVNPYGYLVKPFEPEDVKVAIEIALSNFANEGPRNEFVLNDSLFVKYNNLSVKVPIQDIYYVKAEGNYSIIQLQEKNYTLRSTLKDIGEKLPAKDFFRSHKSFIINLKKVTAINSIYVYLDNWKLPIGRQQLQDLMSSINKV